jgi:hypothetical protein
MDIQFPVARPVDLVGDTRKVKSSSPQFLPSILSNRLSLGFPLAVRLNQERIADDGEASEIIRSDRDHLFSLITVSCTFHPSEEAPFQKAWLRVMLRDTAGSGDAPIAWSMKPLDETDVIEDSTSLKLEAGTKLLHSLEPRLTLEGGQKTARKESLIRAFGLQESEPYWLFQKTASRDLMGAFRLILVVRRSRLSNVYGRLDVKATVKQRTFVLAHTVSFEPATDGIEFPVP